MPFVYPKPLVVGPRTWDRADSFVNPAQGNQVMYKLNPRIMGMSPYDHISIVVGVDGRPADNEIHATMKGAVPFVFTPPNQPKPPTTVQIGNGHYQKSLLVFYWDFNVQYNPPGLAPSTAHNRGAGRPAKVLQGEDSLSSAAVAPFTAVSSRQDLKALRDHTSGTKGPAGYATQFWSDLLAAQPITIQVEAALDDDSLELEYSITSPTQPVPRKGNVAADGLLTLTTALVGGPPSQCTLILSQSPYPVSFDRRGLTMWMSSGRYGYRVLP